jgi:membrane protease subunit (stomatin/prohibitin family)
METFKTIGKRFTYGGDTGKDQRVYYFNTKEIPGNKFGTPNPVPFRVVDKNIGLDVDISVRANGLYSYKIVDPLLFYTNVTGNVAGEYRRDEIDATLRSEFLNALQPAFAKISAMGIRYSELPGHTMELSDAMNEVLSGKWGELRGLEIITVSINSITAPPEDEEMIKQLQRSAVYRDPSMAGAAIVGAQADAMRDAANNPSGAMGGFIGMGMARDAGGANADSFFRMAEEQKRQQQPPSPQQGQGGPAPTGARWFCPECGTENNGKFCTNCGTKKPEQASGAKCNNCGWENPGLEKAPNFCPDCGNKI